MDGRKHVLGVWLGDGGEGAKYWLSVLTEIRNRGLEDALIVCCDGLKGLPDAIEATWPQALVQTCVIHLLRASMRLCSWKNRKAVVAGLRRVYTAVNAETAAEALDELEEQWGNPLSRCYTNMAPGVGRVHPVVADGSRQSFARSCTQPTSSKASTINYGKSPKPGGISPPTNPLSSCCASPPET